MLEKAWCSVVRGLLAFFLIARFLGAQQSPEVVSNTPVPRGFHPQFKIATLDRALLDKVRHTSWHQGCPVSPADLRKLTLSYWNFDRKPENGILIVHKDVAAEVQRIFRDLFEHGFLIERMVPVEEYGGDDNASMAANNTSAFNCRDVTGRPGRFSNHSWGRAIDINPLTNPYIRGDSVQPSAGRAYLDRTVAHPGSILAGGFAVSRFAKDGWVWGGSWTDLKDYQHFEKPAPPR